MKFHWEHVLTTVLGDIYRCQTKQTTVEIHPRPHYCDRGSWLAHVDCPEYPHGFPINPKPFDHADAYPRYYFDLQRAIQETEAMFRKRGYEPADLREKETSE